MEFLKVAKNYIRELLLRQGTIPKVLLVEVSPKSVWAYSWPANKATTPDDMRTMARLIAMACQAERSAFLLPVVISQGDILEFDGEKDLYPNAQRGFLILEEWRDARRSLLWNVECSPDGKHFEFMETEFNETQTPFDGFFASPQTENEQRVAGDLLRLLQLRGEEIS